MVVGETLVVEHVEAGDEVVGSRALRRKEVRGLQDHVDVVALLVVADPAERGRVVAGAVARAVEQKRPLDQVGVLRARVLEGEVARGELGLHEEVALQDTGVVHRHQVLGQ